MVTEVEPVQIGDMLSVFIREGGHGLRVSGLVSLTRNTERESIVLASAGFDTLGGALQAMEAAMWAWVNGGAIQLFAELDARPDIWTLDS